MSNLTYTFTFSTGQTILASSINANFTSVANKINGGLDSDNFGTISGALTWNVLSAGVLAGDITTAATEGALKILQNGVLASGKSGFKISSSAAQISGDALAYIAQSSGSSTIPALKVDTSVGEMLGVRKAGTTFRRPSSTKTTTYTATATDGILYVDASSASWTLTLPAVASSQGVVLEIIRTDQNLDKAVTIDGNASETINGATTFKLCTQYERVKLHCDGSAWYIVEHSYPSTWTSYTPSMNLSTNATATGKWRRIGDSIQCQVRIAFSGANTQAVNPQISPPTGLTIDTAKIALTQGTNGMFGQAAVIDASSGTYNGHMAYNNTTTMLFRYNAIVGGAVIYSGHVSPSTNDPMVIANNDALEGTFTVPITDWEG